MEHALTDAIVCPVHEAAQNFPDRVALVQSASTLTYGEFDASVSQAVGRLQKLGIRSGDVVAVLADNSINYAVLFFAAFRLGFTLMSLNTRLTESEWQEQINQAGCHLLIADKHHHCRNVHSLGMDEILSGAEGSTEVGKFDNMHLDRRALVIFSSGVSGASRGAVLTWKNLYYSAVGISSVMKYGANDYWLAVLPFFHVGGISILFRAALAQIGVRVMARFNPDEILGTLTAPSNCFFSVVPTMLHDLMIKDEQNLLRNLKAIIIGGDSFEAGLRAKAVSRNLPVLTTYGLTETASMVTLLPMETPPDKLTSVGKLLPFRELEIVDENGGRLAANRQGKIRVRGPVLFTGYINTPEIEIDANSWFETGDTGYLDDEGFLTVTGREKHIIISGGENIDLNQIEKAISTLDGVSGAVVLSRADSKWGERPVAFVVSENDRLTEETIRDRLRGLIAPMMIPDRIIVAEHLPLTGSGKYDRSALRKLYGDLFCENN